MAMRYLFLAPIAIGVIAMSFSASSVAQTRPKAKAKAPGQVVNPAPVNYWMDVSTGATGGGGGMLGGMMSGMMARGAGGGGASTGGNAFGSLFGGSSNWFGAANSGASGQRTDIAIFDRRQAGTVNATQAIPATMRLGASLPLLAPPPPSAGQRTPFEERPSEPPQMPDGRIKMTIKAYWGCGEAVRTGQPRIQTFELGGPEGMAMYGSTVQGRYERDRGATSNNKSSIWPNRNSNNAIPAGASLVGSHQITGAGLPASLNFAIQASQDFMPDLGLRASGTKAGVLTLNWTNLPTASAYFAAATGMIFTQSGENDNEMTMITWSASELPESGMGLINYVSNANQDAYLRDKVILPAGTTSCAIPSGIFADTMMITLNGIAYGRELNLVHPQRPTDPRTPWNQEWTARVRVKSQSSVMMMGDVMGTPERSGRSTRGTRGGNEPTPAAQANLPKCKPVEQATAGAAGRAILGAVGGGILGGLARQRRERPGIDCTP